MTAEKKAPSGARPSWVLDAKPKPVTPLPVPPRPGKPTSNKLGLLVGSGAVLLVVVGLLVFFLTRSPAAEQPMDAYLTAKSLLEQGKDMEAAAAVSRARKIASDPRHLELLGELEKEIEQAPRLKIAAQLLESKQYPAAGQVLREVIKTHPKSERAKTMLASLEAAQARAESTATRSAQPASSPSTTAPPLVVPSQPRHPARRPAGHPKQVAAPPSPAPAPAPAPAPTPAPAPAPSADHGQVRVEASEAATVYVDGKAAGRAPANLSLRPGMHTVEVRADRDGSVRAQRRVMVAAGMSSTVELKLKKKSIDSNNPYGE